MKRLMSIYAIQCAILFCIVSMGAFQQNNSIYSIIVILLYFIEFFYFLFLIRKNNTEYKIVFTLFLVSFIVRLFLIYYDVNIQEIDPGDSRDFRMSAENFFFTNKASFRNIDFSFTTLFMGIIDKIFGPQRVIIQFCNTLCFNLAAYITYKILMAFKVNYSIIFFVLSWMLFSPQNIKSTAVSNREGFISFFVAVSVYYFCNFVRFRKINKLLLSLCSALICTLLHSATLAIAVGYIFYYILYDFKQDKYVFTLKSVMHCIIIVFLTFIVFNSFGDLLTTKFGTIENVSDIAKRANPSHGGSSYDIAGADADSITDLILYTPIRTIYYLLSPMPWDWRGISDIIAFFVCSVPQILIIWQSIKKIKNITDVDNKASVIALLVSAISISIVFGWGVKNAGTAIRHRDKFLSLYSCILGILFTEKKEVKTNEKKNSCFTGA